jgi:four helix bundle protein
MTEKEQFVEDLKKRTKQFAIDVILFCNLLKTSKASSVVAYQLIKSASSTGANYRTACRGRSKAEFFSKICVAVEEIDESEYWLEIIAATNLSDQKEELTKLSKEANELSKIMSAAKNSCYKNK